MSKIGGEFGSFYYSPHEGPLIKPQKSYRRAPNDELLVTVGDRGFIPVMGVDERLRAKANDEQWAAIDSEFQRYRDAGGSVRLFNLAELDHIQPYYVLLTLLMLQDRSPDNKRRAEKVRNSGGLVLPVRGELNPNSAANYVDRQHRFIDRGYGTNLTEEFPRQVPILQFPVQETFSEVVAAG